MKRKIWLPLALILAAALGAFLPQLLVDQVEGSSSEVTFQFLELGIETPESQQNMHEILDNIVGITRVDLNPREDSITITFDEETMKAEWIAKSLEAHGYTPRSYRKVK